MPPIPASQLVPLPSRLVPYEQDHIADLSFPLGVELCVNLTFYMICWTIMHLPFCQEINFRANVSSIGAALKVCQELVQPFSWHRWLDERESKK